MHGQQHDETCDAVLTVRAISDFEAQKPHELALEVNLPLPSSLASIPWALVPRTPPL